MSTTSTLRSGSARRRRPRQLTILAATLAVGALLTACAGEPDQPAASDPPESAPKTLRMAHIDAGPALDPATVWFTEAVADVSGGRLTVEQVFECCGGDPDVEKVLVEDVAAGDYELGWVGARVFDGLGVPTLSPLVAPMMLDSYAVQQDVMSSDVVPDLLAGLDEVGVDGLAVMPGPLRRPIGAARPLVTAADWDGATVHLFPSSVGAAAFEALGATPTQVGFDERNAGLEDGSIDGLENAMAFHANSTAIAGHATTNVALWPRVSALIAHPDSLESLTDQEREWLDQAAAAVVERTPELAEYDLDDLITGCNQGGERAAATKADRKRLVKAFEPVYDDLAADPKVADIIERIEAIKVGTTPEPPLAVLDDNCAPPEAAGAEGDLTVASIGDAILVDHQSCVGCTPAIEVYADLLASDTGQDVEPMNLSDTQNSTWAVQLLERLDDTRHREMFARTDVVVVSIGMDDQVFWDPSSEQCNDFGLSFDSTFTLAQVVATASSWEPDCVAASVEKVRPRFAEIYGAIAEGAQKDAQAIALNTFDIWQGWCDERAQACEGLGEDVTTTPPELEAGSLVYHRAWNKMLCEEAVAAGFTCLDVHTAFNGADGTGHIGELTGPDYIRLSQAGHDLVAELLVEATADS